MYNFLFFLASFILSVSCLPASMDYDYPNYPHSLYRRQSYPSLPYPSYPKYQPNYPSFSASSSFGDEITRMLDELQKTLNTRVATIPARFPTFEVSSEESEEDYPESGPSVISIPSSGFNKFFNSFGSFAPTDVKNKTTVKTEVIDGHKVTIKESTFVSDNGGFKSVVHLSEVDVGDSVESNNDKPSTTPKVISDEESEETDKEESSTSKETETSSESPVETSTSNESQTKSAVTTTTTTTEKQSEETIDFRFKTTPIEKDSEENTINKSEDDSDRAVRNPKAEVEEIDVDNNSYFSYKTADKVKDNKEENILFEIQNWKDNEIDSTLPSLNRVTRQSTINLHDDTRVNQLISEKQKNSGLYSIDPDAELLDENTYYEVDGRRPGSNDQQVYYQKRPNQGPNSVYERQRTRHGSNSISNQQTQRRRQPNYQREDSDYQRRQVQPNRQPKYDNGQYIDNDDYQRQVGINDNFQYIQMESANNYQRMAPEKQIPTQEHSLSQQTDKSQGDNYPTGDIQHHIPITFK